MKPSTKSVMSIVLSSIVAILALPNMASAKTYTQSKTNTEVHYWQKKFNRIISEDITRGLKLLEYKIVGKITTAKQTQKFIKKCLDENAYVMYDVDNIQKSFVISTIKDIKNNNSNVYEYFKRHLDLVVSRMQTNDTDIVCLTWEYNGKRFNSYAAVTDTFRKYSNGKTYPEVECIIFDNILTPIEINNCTPTTISYGNV